MFSVLTIRNDLVCFVHLMSYSKILIISPGLMFVRKAFSLGLFLEDLVFRGACYQNEFCVSKWVWLVNKNSLKN